MIEGAFAALSDAHQCANSIGAGCAKCIASSVAAKPPRLHRSNSQARGLARWTVPARFKTRSASALDSNTARNAPSAAGGITSNDTPCEFLDAESCKSSVGCVLCRDREVRSVECAIVTPVVRDNRFGNLTEAMGAAVRRASLRVADSSFVWGLRMNWSSEHAASHCTSLTKQERVQLVRFQQGEQNRCDIPAAASQFDTDVPLKVLIVLANCRLQAALQESGWKEDCALHWLRLRFVLLQLAIQSCLADSQHARRGKLVTARLAQRA